MAQKPLSVLISGAGVAGSSLAYTLARHPSFKLKPIITLIERSPVPRTTGQAVDIRGPGVDVIRNLRLEPDIKARHTSETGLAFVDSRGKIVAQFDATGDPKQQSATSEYEILRGDLARILLDGVHQAKEKGADLDIVYGESIEWMEDRDEGVDVKFTHGKLERQTFDVVIGADGIASKTRSLMFGQEDRREHVRPSGLYIGFFTIPRIPEDDELCRWCSLPSGMGMHLRPHGNGKTMGVYFTITNSKKAPIPEIEPLLRDEISSQKAYLHKRFQNAGWQSERFVAGLDAADDFYMTHWCQVVTPQWAKGRCTILGDAAFATMGVGTSLALIGAYTIAGELSRIGTTADVPVALQNYETVFRPYTSKFEKALPGVPQIANPQTALGVGVLHATLRTVVALGLNKLFARYVGAGEKEGWTLPNYGWEQAETK